MLEAMALSEWQQSEDDGNRALERSALEFSLRESRKAFEQLQASVMKALPPRTMNFPGPPVEPPAKPPKPPVVPPAVPPPVVPPPVVPPAVPSPVVYVRVTVPPVVAAGREAARLRVQTRL